MEKPDSGDERPWWSLVPIGLALFLWGGLALSGLNGIRDVAAQHAPGYPAMGQIILYLIVPATGAALSLGLGLMAFFKRSALAGSLLLMLLFLSVPYFLFAGGGV